MDNAQFTDKLTELKNKQATILAAWQRTGNKELLQFITEILPGNLGAERCGIFIVDPVRDSVWILTGTYVEERTVEVSMDTSIVGQVIKSGEPMEVFDLENRVGDHDIMGMKTGFITRNILCVPLKSKEENKCIGAIELLNKRGSYTDKDRATLQRLATLVQSNVEQIYNRQEMLNVSAELAKHIKHLENLLLKANLQADI